MTQFIRSLKKGVEDLHKSNLWDDIKPTGENQQRVNEYITQGRADLVRCIGNLERAEREVVKVENDGEGHAS